jgi:hypothetical protein
LSRRQHSRRTRLARFLATAPGYEWTGTNTARLAGRAFGKTCMRMPLQEYRAPPAKIFWISARFLTRSTFENPCSGISEPLPRGAASVGLLLVGGSQLTSPLCPTPLKDEAPAFCLHAGAKAEFAGSTDLAGLIGTLHFQAP